MSSAPLARTSLGALRGVVSDGVCVFRGVPYAAAPVGDRRFAPPQPHPGWRGERDATGHGPVPPQPLSRLRAAMGDFKSEQSEDCLTLTISTPAADQGKRPVILWLHGGAFWTGAGSLDWYAGAPMARHGDVVVVGVNHRLGALGFMNLPGISPPNLGLHDQIAALAWVRQEISAFGGDPDNITVAGQSAGGFTILAMLSNARIRSLFRRAIIQSAPFGRTVRSLAAAQAIGEAIQAGVGATTLEKWRSVPVETIVQTQLAVAKTLVGFCETTPPFIPVADRVLIGDNLMGTAAVGALDCDVMVGYTRDEMGAFFAQDEAVINADDAAVASVFARFFGADAPAAIDEYRQRALSSSARHVLGELLGDASFAAGAHDFAQRLDELGRPGWVYRFDWAAPNNPFGACHCIELPFMFDTLPAWDAPMLKGGDPPQMQQLAAQMRDAWVAFARTGDPNHAGLPHWPRYQAQRQTMLFDQHSRVAMDPAGKRRWQYWP